MPVIFCEFARAMLTAGKRAFQAYQGTKAPEGMLTPASTPRPAPARRLS